MPEFQKCNRHIKNNLFYFAFNRGGAHFSTSPPNQPSLPAVLIRYNRMYRTLAHSEGFRRLPDRSIAVDNVIRNVYGALLDIFFHRNTLTDVFYIL